MSTGSFEGLREIIAKDYALPPESLTRETSLGELAIDSLALIELIFTLEERFDVVAADASRDFGTLGEVADYIDQLIAQRDSAGGSGSAA